MVSGPIFLDKTLKKILSPKLPEAIEISESLSVYKNIPL